MCMHTCVQAHQIPLELKFCAVVSHIVWVLETKLKSSALLSIAERSLQPHLSFKG